MINPVIISTAKTIATIAASAGSGVILKNIVQATTPENVSTFSKVLMGFGGFAMGAAVGKVAANAMTEVIDETVTLVEAVGGMAQQEVASADSNEG